MGWRDARKRIAAILGQVVINDPLVAGIARVYQTPPPTVEDVPCFIIMPPALKVERGSSLRIKTYTVRLRCLVSDEDFAQAADLVDAFREAVVDAFDSDVRLDNTVTLIVGPNIEEARGWLYGSSGAQRAFTGMDCLLTVVINEAKAFS